MIIFFLLRKILSKKVVVIFLPLYLFPFPQRNKTPPNGREKNNEASLVPGVICYFMIIGVHLEPLTN